MLDYYLTVTLKSDATFGRGEGVAGLVDQEIEHDQYGMPFINGRTLKGLLVEEWANLRFALRSNRFDSTACWLFGVSGATRGTGGAMMHVGAAELSPDLRQALRTDPKLSPSKILAALTTIRRQTALDAEDAAPEEGSLRAMRALIRGTQLIAPLQFDEDPQPDQLALLAACALAVRRGGSGRNRGRGRLALLLHQGLPTDYSQSDAVPFFIHRQLQHHQGMPTDYSQSDFTKECFDTFVKQVQP